MKKLMTLLIASLGLAVLPACGQPQHPSMISFRVVDDLGAPVSEGEVKVSTFSHWVPGEGFGRDEYDQRRAPLDKKGEVSFEVPNIRGDVEYAIYPQGKYYPVTMQSYRFKEVKNGRWEPWNPEVTVIIPRMINPIPLYARKIGLMPRVRIPDAEKVGFDLVESDWVSPHGKGKRADLFFEYRTIVPMLDEAKVFECALTVSFANEGDGILPYPAQLKRRLWELPRLAPAEGYAPKFVKTFGRSKEGEALTPYDREDQNYFFRVRTVIDPSGKVISALYGKIHGDIVFDALRQVRFTYYLNPTSLDRNLEFDPKRNLFPNRMSGTNIIEP